ncbi:MAG TPA: bifunctional glutamate N-acetyltransferase/amino-acid acetyltransferase ArgJ [Dehalococcoidia bacterium]|nr:bifunctional glutamate N-acetyltransferase/amino-acid acetyltransferase ArgJ [Dehalococcoidia bacterium]
MSRVDPLGSVTSVPGFRAGATYAGIKTYGEGKLDVAILVADRPCNAAGTFTKNRLHAASVDVDRLKLEDRRGQAVVINAGVANSNTGERGFGDAMRLTEWVAAKLGLHQDDVFVCSTGVIGHFLPMEKLENGVRAIELSNGGGVDLANAIMTTDTRPKHGSVSFGPFTIGGCVKGSGMIHPNMATMLAFLVTDAPVEAGFLQEALSSAVDESFNLVSVDGDTSPSDTVLFLARDPDDGVERIASDHHLAGEFRTALADLSSYLAREIARDGEGATKLLEVKVGTAASMAEARELVRLLATSYLLKSAVHGADPNWGRIVAIIGRSSVEVDEPTVKVSVCGHTVFEKEEPTDFDETTVSRAMEGDTVTIEIELGVGDGSATGWGCDLTSEYVHINADYHT